MNDDLFFQKLKILYDNLDRGKQSLLEQYREANQKYPIGFTFPYQCETAKINRCEALLLDDEEVCIVYICYVPQYCDREITTASGMVIMGDSDKAGVQIFQTEIDRILEEI